MSIYSYHHITTCFVTFFISWICIWNAVNSQTTITCESDTDCQVICGSDCIGATIDGTNANNLYVKCNSNKCDDVTIQCPSTNCSVKCSGSYSCDHININAQSANIVSLSAFGEDAFHESTLLAKSAESVNIKCTSNKDAACAYNHFYLPLDTTFNCYGKGCASLGVLYIGGPGLEFNINGCGVCGEEDTEWGEEGSCFSFRLHCALSSTLCAFVYIEAGWDRKLSFEWSFVDEPTDDECYPRLTAGEIAGIVLGSIGGLICIICICVKIRRQQKQPKKEQDPMGKISECNKSETNTENRFAVRNKKNSLEIESGEKQNEPKCGPLKDTEKEVVDDRRKIAVHSGNQTVVQFVFRDLNELEDTMYLQMISWIKTHLHLPNDCLLSLYEKVNGQNIAVDDMDDIIDSFDANSDGDNYVLHLYIYNMNGTVVDHVDCLEMEGQQNEEIVIDAVDKEGGELDQKPKVEQATIESGKRKRRRKRKVYVDVQYSQNSNTAPQLFYKEPEKELPVGESYCVVQ